MADPRDVENLDNQEPDEILVDGHPELPEPHKSRKKTVKPAPRRRPGTKADRERVAAQRTGGDARQSGRAGAKDAPRAAGRSPRWWAPLMVILMVVGLLFVVAYYLFGGRGPIPSLGNINLFLGFGIMIVGFLMTMGWK